MYIDEDLISMMIIQRKSQMNIFTRILQHLQQYQKKKLIEMEENSNHYIQNERAGIEFECSLSEVKDFETAIRGMKQKLREKKNA